MPVGAYKYTPCKEVRRNESFKGLTRYQASDLTSFQHFRKVQDKKKRDMIDRDEGIYNDYFLEDISNDYPKGSWNILNDTSETVVLVRNKLWPGYLAYHKMRTPIFGAVYIGDGIKNVDLPFMV